jgi:predicted AlkP superfamily phosphohydrolase/phosphomutase
MAPQTRRKVIVFGWDGADFSLAQRWADAGRLPTLAAMREQGAFGRMASTIPPVSAPAWATFVTGNNPGRHGIYYFKEHIAGTYETRLVNGADRRSRTIWQMLNAQGRTMGVVNLAMTYPPEPLQGFMISGMDTPSEKSEFTYPPALKDELLHALGEYIIEPTMEGEAHRQRYDLMWDKIWANLENSIAAVRYLLAHKECDVFAVNFRATDRVQHHFWKFMDPTHPLYEAPAAASYRDRILRVYQRLDEFAGEVRASLDADTSFVIMSDHGFGPISNKVLYLNNWLVHQGWLTPRRQNGVSPAGDGAFGNWLKSLLWRGAWIQLRHMTPQRLKELAERVAPGLYQRIRYPAAYFFIDWERSQAYADEYQESIWINLAGREPHGIVQPGAEYETLRRAIVDGLRRLKDPRTDEPVIEMAYLREEIYHGAELGRAPDIIIIPRQDPYYRVRPSHTSPDGDPIRTLNRAQLLAEHVPNGAHRLYGMFYAQGPGIAAGRHIQGIGIADMAPTLLQLAGCRTPRGLDGRVIERLFDEPPNIAYFDDETDAGASAGLPYDKKEAELVAGKLRGLGYLE